MLFSIDMHSRANILKEVRNNQVGFKKINREWTFILKSGKIAGIWYSSCWYNEKDTCSPWA
jgi:hypothetical protein